MPCSQAQKTGNDTFLMGPSGYGFLHPALIPIDSPLLTEFVTNTVEAAQQLSMTSYVHWDVDDNGLSHRQVTPSVALRPTLVPPILQRSLVSCLSSSVSASHVMAVQGAQPRWVVPLTSECADAQELSLDGVGSQQHGPISRVCGC